MTRTTISISEHLLKQLKTISGKEHRTLGHTLTELVNLGLSHRRQKEAAGRSKPFHVKPFSMGKERVNILDKEALYRVLDDK